MNVFQLLYFRVTKQRDPESGQQSLMFEIDYPEIAEGVTPRHRFMSAYEQKIEPPDRKWQYLLFAAEPYETVAFKVGENKKVYYFTEFQSFLLCNVYSMHIGSPSYCNLGVVQISI